MAKIYCDLGGKKIWRWAAIMFLGLVWQNFFDTWQKKFGG